MERHTWTVLSYHEITFVAMFEALKVNIDADINFFCLYVSRMARCSKEEKLLREQKKLPKSNCNS